MKLWHLIEPFNFIARNMQEEMSWEQKLKQNAATNWKELFSILFVHIISSVISLNTCRALFKM